MPKGTVAPQPTDKEDLTKFDPTEAVSALVDATTDEEKQLKVLTKINSFCEIRANHQVLVDANVDEKLLVAMQRSQSSVKLCMAVLASLSESWAVYAGLGQRWKAILQAVTSLLPSLQSPDTLDDCLVVLDRFCNIQECREYVLATDVLTTVVAHLKNADADVRKDSLCLLDKLISSNEGQTKAMSANPLPFILEQVKSDYPDIIINSLECLRHLIQNDAAKEELVKPESVIHFIKLLAHKKQDVMLSATKLLSVLSAMVDMPSLPDFKRNMTLCVKQAASKDVQVKTAGLDLITAILQNENNLTLFRECSGLSAVASNLQNIDVKNAALVQALVGAVEILSKKAQNQNDLLGVGAVDLIMAHALDKDDVARGMVLQTFTYLSHQNALVVSRIRQTGGFKIMFDILQEELTFEEPRHLSNALELFQNLCQNAGSDISEFSSLMLPFTLASMLNNPNLSSEITSKTCLVLSALLHDRTALAQFMQAEGFPMLKQLLFSEDSGVSLSCVKAVIASLNSETVSESLSTPQILSRLYTLKKRDGFSSIVSTLLEKLFEHNLVLKFAILDHLEEDDTIADGFYDFKFQGVDDLKPLSELARMPVDNNREILLVDNKDSQLLQLLEQAKVAFDKCENEVDLVKIVAELVSNAMGHKYQSVTSGCKSLPTRFQVMQVKLDRSSNVVPICSVSCGQTYHRALLFKVICDHIRSSMQESPRLDLKVGLCRGRYEHTWNTVKISEEKFIVDLNCLPGALLRDDSDEGKLYVL